MPRIVCLNCHQHILKQCNDALIREKVCVYMCLVRAMDCDCKEPHSAPCMVSLEGWAAAGWDGQVLIQWEGVPHASLAGGMENWKDRKSQRVVRVRLVLWSNQS